MKRPDSDLELRFRLVKFALKRGLRIEEAEDLAGDAWFRTSRSMDDGAPEEIAAFAFLTLRRLMIDHWFSPKRILAKRIDLVIARSVGADPIEARTVGAETMLGLRSQRGVPALGASEVEGLSMGDFLSGNRGLGCVDPKGVATRLVLERFFSWLGKPVERSALVALLAPILVAEPYILPFDPDFDLAVEPTEPEVPLYGFWESIEKLPSAKMRAAILLKLDEDLLNRLQPRARERLPGLIQSWTPPPSLSKVELPAPDALVAQGLGIEKGYLQVLRNRALAILQPALSAFLGLPSAPAKEGAK